MKVLILDGENRSALAAVRSLGRQQHEVFVTGWQLPCVASASRFCTKSFKVPNPFLNGLRYVSAIIDIAGRENINIVIPMTEQSIYLINKVRDAFNQEVIVACPASEKMSVISDKNSLFKLAQNLNISIPATFYLSGPGDLPPLLDQINKYPVVIKPALSKIPVEDGFLSASVKYASSQAELEEIYESNNFLYYPSMIQEKIVGPGTGLFTLYDEDRHLALFSHKRLLEKPPSGGVSVVSESVPLDEEMVDASDRLLSSVGWKGVAMVEFKRDVRDGKAKLMEINGRFWGSLQLAIASGIDFPSLLVRYLSGDFKPNEPLKDYNIGLRMKWLLGTLDYLLIRLKHKDKSLNLPPGSASGMRAIIDFLKFKRKNTTFDVFDLSDISPFIVECCQYFKELVGIYD